MPTIDAEIRERAVLYLSGVTSLEQFEDWLVSHTWDEPTALASAVEHLLAEHQLLGDDFDQELRLVIETIWMDASPVNVVTGASSITQEEAHFLAPTRTITRPLAFSDR